MGDPLAMARRIDDPATLAEVLGARYYAILAPSNLTERLTNTAELVAVAQRLDDLSNRGEPPDRSRSTGDPVGPRDVALSTPDEGGRIAGIIENAMPIARNRTIVIKDANAEVTRLRAILDAFEARYDRASEDLAGAFLDDDGNLVESPEFQEWDTAYATWRALTRV